MKMMKKLLPFLLCVMMVVAMFAVTTYAAEGATNVVIDVDKTEAQPGDTITVVLSYTDMHRLFYQEHSRVAKSGRDKR